MEFLTNVLSMTNDSRERNAKMVSNLFIEKSTDDKSKHLCFARTNVSCWSHNFSFRYNAVTKPLWTRATMGILMESKNGFDKVAFHLRGVESMKR